MGVSCAPSDSVMSDARSALIVGEVEDPLPVRYAYGPRVELPQTLKTRHWDMRGRVIVHYFRAKDCSGELILAAGAQVAN